jgi:hypothetical protein
VGARSLADREVRIWTMACRGLAAAFAIALVGVLVRDAFPCNAKLTEIFETPAGWFDWPVVPGFGKYQLVGGAEHCAGPDDHCQRDVEITTTGVCLKNRLGLNSWFISHVDGEPPEGVFDPKPAQLSLRASPDSADTFVITGRDPNAVPTEIPIVAFRHEPTKPPPWYENLHFSALVASLLFGVAGLLVSVTWIRRSLSRVSTDSAKNTALAARVEQHLKMVVIAAAIYGGIIFACVMLSISS